MKNSVIALLLVIVAITANISFAQGSKGIKFENDSLTKILAKAKIEGKDIFNEGNIIPNKIIQYLRKAASLFHDQQAEEYFSAYHKEANYDEITWLAVNDFNDTLTVKSPVFKYLIANRAKFNTRYTVDSVDEVIKMIYSSAMNNCLHLQPDTTAYKVLRSELMALKLPSFDCSIVYKDLLLYEIAENWQQYAKTSILQIEVCGGHGDYSLVLNQIAYSFYEHVNDRVYLNKALDWAKCAMEMNANSHGNYAIIDTYASLLFKLERYAEAEAMEKKAITSANKEGCVCNQCGELLTKIRAKKVE